MIVIKILISLFTLFVTPASVALARPHSKYRIVRD